MTCVIETTIDVPLGNTTLRGDDDWRFTRLRKFFVEITCARLGEDRVWPDQIIRSQGIHSVKLGVNKLSKDVVQVAITTDRGVAATVSGEIRDILRIDDYIGIAVLKADHKDVEIKFFEYEKFNATYARA